MSNGLLLIRRRRPVGDVGTLHPVGSAGVATSHGTPGAGRVLHALAEAGVRVAEVTQLVVPADATVAELDAVDLDRRFGDVVLGSHLVNLPDTELRQAYLALAARHLAGAGIARIEHHPLDWLETAADVVPGSGAAVGMVEVRRDPPLVSAVSVFEAGGHVVRQPFTARVLTAEELETALAAVGLRPGRRLSPTWLEASSAGS